MSEKVRNVGSNVAYRRRVERGSSITAARVTTFAVAAAFASWASAGCGAGDGGEATNEADVKAASVGVVAKHELPLPEISGLGRRLVSGKPEYLAVADAAASVLTFAATAAGDATGVEEHDIAVLVGAGPSQLEAVAGDGSGSVFVLAEGASTIAVVDASLTKLRHTFTLVIPKTSPLRAAWDEDPNSRGEGLVLLANGHVLVVKEKDPVAILELAPEGEGAEGYRADLALGDATFPVPRGAASTLTLVHHWTLKANATSAIGDVSDLAIDGEGRIALLSDQGRAIARVERELRADEDRIDVKALFRLPSAVDKPEGLVFASGTPFVAIDAKKPGTTLFALEPLPSAR